MNLYKLLISLSFITNILCLFFIWDINEKTTLCLQKGVIKQEIPKVEFNPQIKMPENRLSETDKLFLESIFNKTVNVTVDHTKHSFVDDTLFTSVPEVKEEPKKDEPKKAKVVK